MGTIEAIGHKAGTIWGTQSREASTALTYLQPGRPEGRRTEEPLRKYLFPAMACGDHSRHRKRISQGRVGFKEWE